MAKKNAALGHKPDPSTPLRNAVHELAEKSGVAEMFVAFKLAEDQVTRYVKYNRKSTLSYHGKFTKKTQGDTDDQSSIQLFSDRPVRSLIEKVNDLVAGLPQEYAPLAEALVEINRVVRQQLAAELAPALNAHLEAVNPQDAAAKKQLASDVMDRLTDLGLAIKCPVTGQPSNLVAVAASYKNPHGRVEIRPKGSSKPTIGRANLADLLPLELVDAPQRREALGEWRDRIGRKSDRPDQHSK